MIGSNAFGLIELLGVFGLILGVLGWQWISIRKTLREDREKAARGRAQASGSPPESRDRDARSPR